MAVHKWLTYDFQDFPIYSNWNEVGGVYIFAGVAGGKWKALYVGKTDNFRARLSNHEMWPRAQAMGASHVHALAVGSDAQRTSVESELIRVFQPPLNTQLR